MNEVRICQRCKDIKPLYHRYHSYRNTSLFAKVDAVSVNRDVDWLNDVIFCDKCHLLTHQPIKNMTDGELIAHRVSLKLQRSWNEEK